MKSAGLDYDENGNIVKNINYYRHLIKAVIIALCITSAGMGMFGGIQKIKINNLEKENMELREQLKKQIINE